MSEPLFRVFFLCADFMTIPEATYFTLLPMGCGHDLVHLKASLIMTLSINQFRKMTMVFKSTDKSLSCTFLFLQVHLELQLEFIDFDHGS